MEERKTFRQAYGVLQEHAQTLRDQTEPNIDELLSIVTESVAAYKVCKERIDAVEKALQEALTGAGVGSASGAGLTPASTDQNDSSTAVRPSRSPASSTKASSTSGFDKMDDDIPF